MPATKYRPIQEVQRSGSVSKTAIREAVEKIAQVRRNNPAKYKELIKLGSTKDVRLIMKHG